MLSICFNTRIKTWRSSKRLFKNNRKFIKKYNWKGINFSSGKNN